MALHSKDAIGNSSTKLYQEDLVKRVESPNSYGVIMRCWHDADDYVMPEGAKVDPLLRPLKQGEVGVSFFPDGIRDILPESTFSLVDRNFQPGDLCKRSIDDVSSGIITSVETKVRLAHAITGEHIDGWKGLEDLVKSTTAEIQDYVLYDDWVGQVIEVFDESLVQIASGQLIRLPEFGSRLAVGDKGDDIVPPAIGVSSMFNFLIGSGRPSQVDTVVDVKHTVLAICWLAINQTLDTAEAQTRRRPERFWYGENLEKLTLIKTRLDQNLRVGDTVVLTDLAGIPTTIHGQEGDPIGTIAINSLIVKETRTSVKVLWQDGTSESLRSTELIPYVNPDEYDCWPGDHVIWKSEDQQRAAVVQSVNARERVASIRYLDTGSIELASALELDTHGTSELSNALPQSHLSSLGVRRADFVFIHQEGDTNGLEKPRVPKIGEVEAWVREVPVSTEGQLSGWRLEMTEVGSAIATSRRSGQPATALVRRPLKDDTSVLWCGEVTGLCLDGSVEVTHPNSTVATYPVERLTKLYDGFDQLEDDGWDELSDDEDLADEDNSEGVWLKDEKGIWQYHLQEADGDEWEETDGEDDDDDLMDTEVEKLQPKTLDISLPLSGQPTALTSQLQHFPTDVPSSIQNSSGSSDMAASHEQSENIDMNVDIGGSQWKRFDMLPSAPPDHAFYSSAPAQPSKAFLGRLSKEYRVLANSLPDSILVRAYEDRTDLLRSVIIGPENTPYEDAPFVIDWMLDSNFPHSPPIAHFLSWTNGNGRVNPNLYEEGKVCLSILGTWSGDKSETWSAARSSLLQAFVSIQGLVLVKEPWFCEPAFEKLRGTDEGTVNSRLYNEKAYCLSRGFVRRALEIPLGGLEQDINWLYYSDLKLEKVIRDSRALIQKSQLPPEDHEDGDLAVPRLTAGGIIALERTLIKLQGLLDTHQRI